MMEDKGSKTRRSSLVSNKKAQGMSTSTIVLLVIGLIVLVVLILGFTLGWQNFAPWLSQNNIDSLQTACQVACSTNDEFGFCQVEREVRDGENDPFQATCYTLSLDEEGRGYGIDGCSQITCN